LERNTLFALNTNGYLIFGPQIKIMFRLYFVFIALILTSISYGQATTLLSEDFQGVFPSGWTTVNNDGLTPDTNVSFITDAWVITPDLDAPTSGDSVITSTSWYSPTGTSDDWLITPAITLGAFGNKFSFKAKSLDGSFPDGFEVYASQFNSIDSFIAHDTLLIVAAESPSWTTYDFSLDSSGLTGQTVFIAFRNNSSDQFLLSLDDVYVGKEHPLNLEDNRPKLMAKMFPNPVISQLYTQVNGTFINLEITSMDGKFVLSSNSPSVDVTNLNSGMYIVKINSSIGISYQQLQKL
jgi:hypothetical protein